MSDSQKAAQLSAEDLKNKFVQACEMQEANALPEAISIYRELLQYIPDSPLIHFNLGLALFDSGDFQAAAEHYHIASCETPEDPDIWYNMGLNFRRLAKQQEAAASFAKAVALGDSSIDTLYNMALCHQDMKAFDQAAELYETILADDANHQSSLNNYAYLCHKTDKLVKAETLYKRLLQLNPQHTAAKHMLNALCGITPDNAPLEYIESVFDGYAENFEKSLLNELKYQTPTKLWQLFTEYFPRLQDCRCLDLGCGTGLAGESFKPVCSTLTGLDISDKILAVAREKNLYQHLVKDDILSFLGETEEHFDLLLAADVFTYMGDLEPLFKACYQKSTAGAVLCFSVEESDLEPFNLKETGRFGHSSDYIEKKCTACGWKLCVSKQSKLRQDKGQWIHGYLYIFQK